MDTVFLVFKHDSGIKLVDVFASFNAANFAASKIAEMSNLDNESTTERDGLLVKQFFADNKTAFVEILERIVFGG